MSNAVRVPCPIQLASSQITGSYDGEWKQMSGSQTCPLHPRASGHPCLNVCKMQNRARLLCALIPMYSRCSQLAMANQIRCICSAPLPGRPQTRFLLTLSRDETADYRETYRRSPSFRPAAGCGHRGHDALRTTQSFYSIRQTLLLAQESRMPSLTERPNFEAPRSGDGGFERRARQSFHSL